MTPSLPVSAARLIIQLPDGSRTAAVVSAGSAITLGRGRENTIQILDETVSRHHARMGLRENVGGYVEDQQSVNGIMLNGGKIDKAELLDGDRLNFGAVGAIFRMPDETAARLETQLPAVGEVFANRYRLELSLGETSESVNYLALEQAAADARVSLRIFQPDVVEDAGGIEAIEAAFDASHRAGTDSRRIAIIDCGRWRGLNYQVSEWVEGYALLDLLRHRGMLDVPGAMLLAAQAAMAADHGRAQGAPTLDRNPRAVLVAFDEPRAAPDWRALLDVPLRDWPPFKLMFAPQLLALSGAGEGPRFGALVAFFYELLGHPVQSQGIIHAVPVAALGERGYAVLKRGLSAGESAFATESLFVEALAHAADPPTLTEET